MITNTPHETAQLNHARELVLAHGWNSTCYQILNPGFQLWFSPERDAVIGYVRQHRRRIVGGAPVCARERLPAVAAAFEADARRTGERVCYFGAEARLEDLYGAHPRYSMIVLGSQPVWCPADWPAMRDGHASLRAQVNRARNKKVVVTEWPPERVDQHPELLRILGEWLSTRGLPPLHFLIEPDTLGRTWDRRCFVAEREGRAVGFLMLSPVPARRGWLVEQFIRGQEAPNGTVELMLDAAMQALIHAGSDYVTLGLAPLSMMAGGVARHNPFWLRALLAFLKSHGNRYYNFQGLETFKAKFRPDHWDPVYAVVNEPSVRIRTLYAIAAAFASGSPLALLARSQWSVVRSQWSVVRSIWGKRRKTPPGTHN